MLLPLIVVPLQVAPVGKPVTLVIVAFVALTFTVDIAEFWQIVCVGLSTLTSGSGFTTIVAVAVPLGVHDGDWLLVAVTTIL